MRLLLVDDTRTVHSFVQHLLEGSDTELLHAYSGEEAIAVLADRSDEIDCVLLDWEMPGMNGLQTLQIIRQDNVLLPVIMVTSRNEIDDIGAAMTSGANEYVMKPFTKDILLGKLATI